MSSVATTNPENLPSSESIHASYQDRSRFRLPEGASLWAMIREDHKAHGRDWTLPGFRAVATQRFGVWCQGVRFMPARVLLNRVYAAMYRYIRNHYGIEVSYTVTLGRRVVIEHHSGIVIHGYSKIGDGCILRQGVTLGVKTIARPYDAPTLARGVDVGAGAKILGPVQIGEGAKIGANAVVLCDVPAGATAVGIPARIIVREARP